MPSLKIKVKAWLQLLRLPNLFTVPGDPLAGFLLASASGEPIVLKAVLPCLIASLLLYAAGLLTNDYFDLETDRRERPFRPLPSGRVAPEPALKAALMLTLLGVAAAIPAGKTATLMAFLLVVASAVYNTKGKRSPWWGPLNIGLCRGLNLLLGAAAAGPAALCFPEEVIVSALGLTMYIACISRIAFKETESLPLGSKRWWPFVVLLIWFPLLYAIVRPNGPPAMLVSAALALFAIIRTKQGAAGLIGVVNPSRVSHTVGRLLRGLLLIQASICSLVIKPGLLLAGVLLMGGFFSSRLARIFYAS